MAASDASCREPSTYRAGVATLWIGYLRDWTLLRWPVALVATGRPTGGRARSRPETNEAGPGAARAAGARGPLPGILRDPDPLHGAQGGSLRDVQAAAVITVGIGGAVWVATRSGLGQAGFGVARLSSARHLRGGLRLRGAAPEDPGELLLLHLIALVFLLSGTGLLLGEPASRSSGGRSRSSSPGWRSGRRAGRSPPTRPCMPSPPRRGAGSSPGPSRPSSWAARSGGARPRDHRRPPRDRGERMAGRPGAPEHGPGTHSARGRLPGAGDRDLRDARRLARAGRRRGRARRQRRCARHAPHGRAGDGGAGHRLDGGHRGPRRGRVARLPAARLHRAEDAPRGPAQGPPGHAHPFLRLLRACAHPGAPHPRTLGWRAGAAPGRAEARRNRSRCGAAPIAGVPCPWYAAGLQEQESDEGEGRPRGGEHG